MIREKINAAWDLCCGMMGVIFLLLADGDDDFATDAEADVKGLTPEEFKKLRKEGKI